MSLGKGKKMCAGFRMSSLRHFVRPEEMQSARACDGGAAVPLRRAGSWASGSRELQSKIGGLEVGWRRSGCAALESWNCPSAHRNNEAVPLGRARWSPEDVVGSNPAVAKCALTHADMQAHARRYKRTHTHTLSLARASKRLNLCKFA